MLDLLDFEEKENIEINISEREKENIEINIPEREQELKEKIENIINDKNINFQLELTKIKEFEWSCFIKIKHTIYDIVKVDSLCITEKGKILDERDFILTENCISVLIKTYESFGLGKEKFNSIISEIKKELIEIKLEAYCKAYQELTNKGIKIQKMKQKIKKETEEWEAILDGYSKS